MKSRLQYTGYSRDPFLHSTPRAPLTVDINPTLEPLSRRLQTLNRRPIRISDPLSILPKAAAGFVERIAKGEVIAGPEAFSRGWCRFRVLVLDLGP